MEWITVFTSFSPAEAQVIHSRLQASNFHAVITNELAALSLGGYSMATGGIRVQVPEDEAADARELIAAGQSSTE